ncbi:hypothetical protein JCM3765_004273 [Sporobolomyces pararoseus]
MGDHQQLVDRLVVVTEEQDVLWVLIVIQQMKELECLEQAINATHSWKGYSALDSIALRSSVSILHRFIAQLLLLKGAISKLEDRANEQFIEMLEEWRNGVQGEAHNAKHLLSLELAEAADWIDENLPSPPNPESLTGEGPLPLLSQFVTSADPISSPVRRSPSPFSTRSAVSSVAVNSSEDSTNSLPITLLLAGLPHSWNVPNLAQMFTDIGVKPVALRSSSRSFAFADVQVSEVAHCIDSLDRKLVSGGTRISCYIANNSSYTIRTSKPINQIGSPRSPELESRLDNSSIRFSHSYDLSPIATSRPSWVHDQVMPPGTTLHLAGLPLHFGSAEIKKLFSTIAVTPLAIRSGKFSSRNNYANVDVETSQVLKCTESLQGKQLEHSRISCYVSKPRGGGQRERRDGCTGVGGRSVQSRPKQTSILHLASVPPHFDTIHVARLFFDIGVRPLGLRLIDCDPRRRKPFAFVEVEMEDEKRCRQALDGVEFEGSTISCYPASSRPREPLPAPPSLRHSSASASSDPSRMPSLPLPVSSAPRPRSRSPSVSYPSRFSHYPSPPISQHHRSRSRSPPPRQPRHDSRSEDESPSDAPEPRLHGQSESS